MTHPYSRRNHINEAPFVLVERFTEGKSRGWKALSTFGICYIYDTHLREYVLKLMCVTPEIEKAIEPRVTSL